MTPELATVPTEPKTEAGDNLSPVSAMFDSLDLEQTQKAYSELDSTLEKLANVVACTLDEMTPHLASMQALLSQRGKERKKVLKKAGLPSWSEWVRAYCSKLDCSFRTIQRHIKQKSGGSGQSENSKPPKTTKTRPGTPVNTDSRQQPTAATPEPDWKSVLSQLVIRLEQFGDKLPLAIFAELKKIQPLLKAHTECQSSDAADVDDDDTASNRGYIVEERPNTNAAGVHYAVVHRDTREVYDTYASRSEADAVCRSLNTSQVFSIRDFEEVMPKAS